MSFFLPILLSCLFSSTHGWQAQHSNLESELGQSAKKQTSLNAIDVRHCLQSFDVGNQRSGQVNPSRALTMFLLAFNAAAAFCTSNPGLLPTPSSARHGQVGMSVLKTTASPKNLEDFFSQAEASKGVVAIGVSEPQHFEASSYLEEAAEKYTWSRLYGGLSCDIIECLLLDDPAMGCRPLALRSIDVRKLPLVAIFFRGKLVKRIHPRDLDSSLSSLAAWPHDKTSPHNFFEESHR